MTNAERNIKNKIKPTHNHHLPVIRSVAQSCPTLCDPMGSLSIANSRSLLKLMSIKSMMSSNHLILLPISSCHPLLLVPPIFPSIRVFYNDSVLHIRWPKY